MLDTIEIHESARQLYERLGDRAEYDAAQKARKYRKSGDKEQAREWELIRQAIAGIRGPHVS